MTARAVATGALAALAVAGVTVGCGTGAQPAPPAATVAGTAIAEATAERYMAADPGGDLTTTRAYDPANQAACLHHKVTSHSALLPSASSAARRGERTMFRRQCTSEVAINVRKAVRFLVRAEWLRREALRGDLEVSPAAAHTDFESSALPAQLHANALRVERELTRQMRVTPAEVRARYRRDIDLYRRPETRSLRVVEARTRADAVAAAAALRGGAGWARVVRRFSREASGESATMQRTSVSDAYGRAVFAAPPGAVRGPVRTEWGWYVFEVTGVEAGTRDPIDRVARTIRAALQVEKLDRRLRSHYAAETTCARRYRAPDVPECR